jgi:Flp pilus assembly protein TadD/tRNA A-37 threonylcarbamoyl transferase component Bud32
VATRSLPADLQLPELARSTPHPSARATGADAPPPPAAPPAEAPTRIGRFQIRQWVGEGAFAEVYRAYDPHLDREVALKAAKPGTLGTPRRVKRFLREARAAGNLRHPNIVPLYETGEDAGRHFLVSAFIPGRTLGAVLAEAKTAGSGMPPADAARIARKLAEALGYAHGEGVVHRDVKPENVMIDDKGEPLLMDFGLASRADPDEGEERLTRHGIAVGTPAYMAPEQARADPTAVGPASDQYALGCTLYELLTGRTPFSGPPEVQYLLHQTETPPPPRKLRRGVPRDLETICLKCLEKEPGKRYADCHAVADDLRRWLDGEPISVRRPGLAERAARWVLRNPRRATATAGGAVLVAGVLIAAVEVQRQREADRETTARRLERNAEAVAALLDTGEKALRDGDPANARVALDAAQKRMTEGGADHLAGRLDGLRADQEALRNLDDVDRFRWTPVAGKSPDAAAVLARYKRALGELGVDPDAVAPDEAATRVSGSVIRNRLVAALDRVLVAGRSARVRATLKVLDSDPDRNAFRDAVLAGDREKVAEWAGRAVAREQPPEFVAVVGENRAVPVERRRELLVAAIRRRPGALGLLMAVGETYPINTPAGADERVRWYQAAVGLAPTNPVTHSSLGNALSDRGDRAGAEAEYREAVRLAPTLAVAHNNLGFVLNLRRDWVAAEPEYREALRLDPTLVTAHGGLAWVLERRGNLAEAEAECRAAIRLDPNQSFVRNVLSLVLERQGNLAAAEDERRTALRLSPTNAYAHNGLGWLLARKGDLRGAEDEYRAAIRLDPTSALFHNNLGSLLTRKGDPIGAEDEYRAAIRLDPTDAEPHNDLGALLARKGDLDGAEDEYRAAIRLDPKYDLAHSNLGGVLERKGDFTAAEAEYREAIRLKDDTSEYHLKLGSALLYQGDPAGAEAEYRTAARLDPTDAQPHNHLGHLFLFFIGDSDKAVAEYKDAVRFDLTLFVTLSNLARAERLRDLLPRLPDVLAGRTEPTSAAEACEFASLCAQPFRKRYADAARLYEKAFAADPELAADLNAAHRLNAARSAARAASGEGIGAPADPAERAALREKALTWLRADLALRKEQAASPDAARRQTSAAGLASWIWDPNLSRIRSPLLLAALPSEEGKQWMALWAEVRATRARAQKPLGPPATIPPAE